MAEKELFEKKEEEPKYPSFNKSKKKGKVSLILKHKGRIIVDVNGNGEEIPYVEEKHSKLVIGDPIEF